MWEMPVTRPTASKIHELLMLDNPSVLPHASSRSRDTLCPCSQLISLLFQSWDTFFRNMEARPSGEAGDRRPSTLLRGRTLSHSSDMAQKVVEDHLAVHTLIRAYQVLTHSPGTRVGGGRDTHTHPHYLHFKIESICPAAQESALCTT